MEDFNELTGDDVERHVYFYSRKEERRERDRYMGEECLVKKIHFGFGSGLNDCRV